jgi:disulfide bond formation protein DsbB
MIKLKKDLTLTLILFVIVSALISAFIIQYGLGHKPCKLCLYERIPYFISIILIIKILIYNKYEKITLLILSGIFLLSFILSFYHFGIEQGFIKESLACATDSSLIDLTKEQLLEQLKQNVISCKDVSFRVVGLSLATINSIFSLILSVIFALLFFNYGKN